MQFPSLPVDANVAGPAATPAPSLATKPAPAAVPVGAFADLLAGVGAPPAAAVVDAVLDPPGPVISSVAGDAEADSGVVIAATQFPGMAAWAESGEAAVPIPSGFARQSVPRVAAETENASPGNPGRSEERRRAPEKLDAESQMSGVVAAVTVTVSPPVGVALTAAPEAVGAAGEATGSPDEDFTKGASGATESTSSVSTPAAGPGSWRESVANPAGPGLATPGVTEDTVSAAGNVTPAASPVDSNASPDQSDAGADRPIGAGRVDTEIGANPAARTGATAMVLPSRRELTRLANPAERSITVAISGNETMPEPQPANAPAPVPTRAEIASMTSELPRPGDIMTPAPSRAEAQFSVGEQGPLAPDARPGLSAAGATVIQTGAGRPVIAHPSDLFTPGAPALPPQGGRAMENSAAAAGELPAEGKSRGIDGVKSPLRATTKDVTEPKPVLGTTGAHVSPTMPAGSTLARPTVVHASAVDSGAPAQSDPGVLPAHVALPAAVHDAVEAALNAADRLAHNGQRTVTLRFEIGGTDLNVRVALRGDVVHTTFQTDSPELRTALSTEWQAVTGSPSGERSGKLAAPEFTAADHGAAPFTGGHDGQQNEAGQRSTPSFPRFGVPRAEAGRGPAANAAPLDGPRARSTNSIHLHTLA